MDQSVISTISAVAMGIGLAAAAGFRVFVPLLVAAVAARAGVLHLAAGWQWLGGNTAIIAFATATILEVAAHYSHAMSVAVKAAATPLALAAGTLLMATSLCNTDPLLKWSLAVIAGGGVAGAVHAVTTAAHGVSTVGSAGFLNPLVSTAELALSTILAVLSTVVPILAVIFLAAMICVLALLIHRVARRRRAEAAQGAQ